MTTKLIVADSEERAKAVDGLSAAASITARYNVSESEYLQCHLGHNDKFEEMLVNLYVSLLTFYAKAACYFAHRTFTVVLRNIVKGDEWTSALADIDKAEEECADFIAKLTGFSLLESQNRIQKRLQALLAYAEDVRIDQILRRTSQIDANNT